MKKKICTCFLMTVIGLSSLYAQNWRLIKPAYPTKDAFVAGYSVTDFGAKGDGITDDTESFQKGLNSLTNVGPSKVNGGILFVPAGKYVIKGNLNIPKGVTIRGEWKKPEKGQPIEGTILMAYAGRGDENATPLITMEPAAGVMDLAIWYPEQTPDNIVPYPASIVMGKPKHFGNEYCNVKNITLVNSYIGIAISRVNGGGCPVFYDIYGSPLSVGIEIDYIADVGRIDRVDFSPAYWCGSGLPDSPAAGGSFDKWIYENGTGIMMRKNDWSYTTNITVEGYKVGFNAAPSITNEGSKPNGQNYQLKVIGCKTGIQCDAIANSGIQFTRSIIKNCENGVVVNKGTAGALHFHTCEIDATQNAFVTDAESSTRIMILQNQIQKGNVNINGAILTFIDCDFYNPAPQIVLGRNARSIITGNRFKEKVNIENHSLLECIIDHTPVSLEKLPEFPMAMLETQKQKPDREYLYLATDPEFGANPDGNTDNTQAIQKALDKAAAEGGGIVYLPPGKYKVLGNLNIPSGVELKGALDNSSAPVGPGSILQVYSGKGNLNAQPFMTMKENSGLRGVVFDYPEQKTSDLPNPIVYPYCVQVQGKDVYIVNVGIRAAYQGFDLFTYKCDNHYIDYISGHSLKTGIKVGGGSKNGKICNLQYNLIVYACGYQTKFGSFSNSIEAYKDMVYTYGYENFDFLVVENCKDEWLYNNFAFGAQRGLLFTGNNAENASNGISVGMAIDGARRAYCFDALNSKGFDFINNQIVSTGEPNTRYIETTANFTGRVTLHNSDYWGSALQGVQVENGTVNLIAASFVQPGKDRFANIIGGKLNITASHITLKDPLLNSDNESRFSAQSSVLDGKGITTSKCELWKNNLSNTPTLAIPQSSVLDRTGWIASGSKNSNSANNAIDGKEDTRWTSGSQKEPGDWFKVDMRNKQKFNLIILDTTGSPNDTPAKYELYVSDDDLDWREPIATGEGSSMMTIISIPTQNARYFKVVQTGNTKTNYWSIHEAYVINDDYENAVKSTSQKDSNIFYANGNICLKGFSGKSKINVFRINGEKVFSCQSESQQVQVPMEQGIYVVHVNNQNHSFCKKIIIQ
ncbi:discoidin domain-containing protein [Coprobacter fastidiosus]|jgi:hypothetical protein